LSGRRRARRPVRPLLSLGMRMLAGAVSLAVALAACDGLPTYPSSDPDEVPSLSRARAYFERVTEGYYYPENDTAARRHEIGKIYRLLRLRERVASDDPGLSGEIDAWLIHQACDLAGACVWDMRRCPWTTSFYGSGASTPSGGPSWSCCSRATRPTTEGRLESAPRRGAPRAGSPVRGSRASRGSRYRDRSCLAARLGDDRLSERPFGASPHTAFAPPIADGAETPPRSSRPSTPCGVDTQPAM
jgi:hypothetical protein